MRNIETYRCDKNGNYNVPFSYMVEHTKIENKRYVTNKPIKVKLFDEKNRKVKINRRHFKNSARINNDGTVRYTKYHFLNIKPQYVLLFGGGYNERKTFYYCIESNKKHIIFFRFRTFKELRLFKLIYHYKDKDKRV